MPLDATSLLMQRQGPATGPGGMGSAPLAGAVAPGQDDSAAGQSDAMLPALLAKILGQQAQGNDKGESFPLKQISNMKRLAAVMVAHMDQSHPEVARHMSAAWRALDSAQKAAETAGKNNNSGAAGPPLSFSGAQMADTGSALTGTGPGGIV